MKRHEFKTKLNKTKKQKNAEIGGYIKKKLLFFYVIL